MRNMLQLLGGVAVAGAVAAGTTAFTASGLTKDTSLNSGTSVGGSVSVSVNGVNAKLMAATINQDATDLDQLKSVTITMTQTDGITALADGAASKLKAKFTGTGGNGAATWAACTLSGSTGTGIFTCNVPGGYYEVISAVQIAYVP